MKNLIPRRGYMWQLYGFTNTHIWGVQIVGGLMAGVGAATLTFALLLIGVLPSGLFYKLISASGCAFLGGIAVTLGSILSLSFYSGADDLGLLEKDTKTEPSVGGDGKPAPQP